MDSTQDTFARITSLENLFAAWDAFRLGKTTRKDVAAFAFQAEEHICNLHRLLRTKTYKHGPYYGFYIRDPKQRHIHKATVQDRLVHHALFRILEPLFEPMFIHHSYSCRKTKGTHRAVLAFEQMLRSVSQNNTRSCFVLKCDIRKFFYSINHGTLLRLVGKKVADTNALWLINEVVQSFPHGLPIGNLTSQLFANIYLHELDRFVKQELRVPCYVRYADDFVIIDTSTRMLQACLSDISNFLAHSLQLQLHPNKVSIRKYHQGIDFLGYVQFPTYRLLRTKTKHRLLQKAKCGLSESSLQSYRGVLSHCNGTALADKITNQFWFTRV